MPVCRHLVKASNGSRGSRSMLQRHSLLREEAGCLRAGDRRGICLAMTLAQSDNQSRLKLHNRRAIQGNAFPGWPFFLLHKRLILRNGEPAFLSSSCFAFL